MLRFVWLTTHGRLHPEKWAADAPAGCVEGRTIVAERALTPNEGEMSLGELAARYPGPVELGA